MSVGPQMVPRTLKKNKYKYKKGTGARLSIPAATSGLQSFCGAAHGCFAFLLSNCCVDLSDLAARQRCRDIGSNSNERAGNVA